MTRTDAPPTPDAALPRISVVTPSFNQVAFVDRTVRSVLDQGYAGLEYLVIDGGSTDGSVDLLRRHAGRFAWFVSEPDAGQSAAINKGFARSTGEVLCWLNSDDRFADGTLAFVGRYFADHPGVDVLCGQVRVVDAAGRLVHELACRYAGPGHLARYWQGYHMHQPAMFWRRSVYRQIGGLGESLQVTMDYEYWLRMADAGFAFATVDRVLADATQHAGQKNTDGYVNYRRHQRADVVRRYARPWTFRRWDARVGLYAHLLSTWARQALGRPTVYNPRVVPRPANQESTANDLRQ